MAIELSKAQMQHIYMYALFRNSKLLYCYLAEAVKQRQPRHRTLPERGLNE